MLIRVNSRAAKLRGVSGFMAVNYETVAPGCLGGGGGSPTGLH